MGLETGTYISDLVEANPAPTDPKSQGDDHLRLIKTVLQNSLAGMVGLVLISGSEAQGASVSDYTVTVSPAPGAYTTGFVILFKAAHTNTGAATVQINALGTKPLVNFNGGALQAGDIQSGAIVCAYYDGTSALLCSGNDRSYRHGDTYTGAHDYTGASIAVPTAAQGDADTSAASTAFVDGNFARNYGQVYTGTQDFTGASPKVPTASPGTNDTTAASTAFAVQLAFQAALPVQSGNANKFLQTSGTAASWQYVGGATNILFGDGSDGDVTVSGAVTLSRDMYYHNLTLTSGAALQVNGFRIFVANTLDLTAAPAGAIKANGGNGGAGSNGTAGTAGTVPTPVTAGVGGAGAGGSFTAGPGAAGGNGGIGGASGAAASGSGSAGGTVSATVWRRVVTLLTTAENGSTLISGGAGGANGEEGGTTGGTTGPGGAGAGGGVVQIFARFLTRGASTAVGAIQAKGGAGGAGCAGQGGTAGGASAGAGGGGGWVFICCEAMTGSTATNAIDVTGGAGGIGGNGFSTGSGAFGGGAGAGGRFTLSQNGPASFVDTLSSAGVVAPIAGSGSTGGAGATPTTARFSL